jgi:ubiquitin-like-conjugating enzyme ATG3
MSLNYLRKAREYLTPTLKSSAFLDKGVLTPEEFVKAGDELVFRCPTWSWEGGDPSKAKSYLPTDKQYLVTRNVPCRERVAEMEKFMAEENGVEGDEDWLVSTIIKESNKEAFEDDFDILDRDGEVVEKKAVEGAGSSGTAASAGDTTTAEEEDEYADMAGFEDDNVIQDDAAMAPENQKYDDNLVKVRTYDLSITYDKYYQTPRVWMIGSSAEGQPLSGKEMMEDVISDYANRTVTIESHPHVSGPHASIHPCQHGKVMKAIVRNLVKQVGEGEEEKGPAVEMYIFIFLKFVSSMIPTISYDFTMDVTADTAT